MIIDFHTHTHHSYDCLMKPDKILAVAKARGLDGIVICDHDTIKGGIEAQNLNKDKAFCVIVGAEIKTNAGDVTGIFLTKEIVARNIADVIREIKAQGGKVILNHPYKGHDLSLVDYSQIDYIEGYNSRLDPEHNQKAVDLATKHNIPILAGSDSHLYSEIALCKTYVDDLELLQPVKCEYRQGKHRHITLSQYIKSIKRRDPGVFKSATIVQAKYSLRQGLQAIRAAFKLMWPVPSNPSE